MSNQGNFVNTIDSLKPKAKTTHKVCHLFPTTTIEGEQYFKK